MRALIQRVTRASVSSEGQVLGAIANGFLVLAGFESADASEDLEYTAKKICAMRLFADADGKMNLDLKSVGGHLLVVSQFTLHAETKKGNRPSFVRAAPPEKALHLYEEFLAKLAEHSGNECQRGRFGADMQVELVNDGPVTIWIDSRLRE